MNYPRFFSGSSLPHLTIFKLNNETLFHVDVKKKSSNKKLKNLFWVTEFGHPNQYTGLPNDLDTSLTTSTCNY